MIWLFLFSAVVFLLTTIGFFVTEGKAEKIYEGLSIVSFCCIMMQLIIFLIS